MSHDEIKNVENCLIKESARSITGKKIEIEMIISPTGKVKSIKIIKNEYKNKKLEKCILRVMKQILFGALQSKTEVNVKCTLQYSS